MAIAAPNIVFILADDMGYGDVQRLNRNSVIPTPNLDSLAADGMTFTDAHSSSGVCTPTRCSLLTGRYSWRTRLKSGVLNGYSEPLLAPGRETFATVAAKAGYQTGIVGKWHLGLGFVKNAPQQIDFDAPLTSTPNDYGFGFSYVIPASLDFPPYVYIHNRDVTTSNMLEQPAQKFPAFLRKGPRAEDLIMEDCLDHLTDQAVGFIRESASGDKPFLLYFPLTAPHKPALPHSRFRGKTNLGPYGDFVVQVDDTVGRILKTIDDAQVRDNTLVIFTSDNGSYMYRREGKDHSADASIQAFSPDHHTSNGPLRGTKADIWEAGHRVPFFARWPEAIRPLSTCDETVCSVDFLATVADINDVEKPDSAVDGYSWLPFFREDPDAERPAPVIHHSGSGMFAIRSGKWKLVLGNGSGGREQPRGNRFERPYALFDLSTDIGEAQDLFAVRPEIAQKLEQKCLEIIGTDR
ncbi:MAG: arylsulfatase [Planctomycetales bacterium]|nr:arylsulfatase [Planctomycetales bacterium]